MPQRTARNTPRTVAAAKPRLSPLMILLGALALVAAVLISSSAQAGKVYRWKTADGVVHYGEHPPGDTQATELSTTTGKPSKRGGNRERVEPGEYTGEEEQPVQVEAEAPPPPKPKKDKDICERARYNLKVLNDRARIRQTDENGEERYLSEEEKDQQKKAAQEAIKTYC